MKDKCAIKVKKNNKKLVSELLKSYKILIKNSKLYNKKDHS